MAPMVNTKLIEAVEAEWRAIAVLAFVLSMQADAAEIPAVLGSVVS